MKKAKPSKAGDLRRGYKRNDFPDGLRRGKYASRMGVSSGVVRLRPEIAAAFPTDKAVNAALAAVLRKRSARLAARAGARPRDK